jgi:hypothetical protein
MPAIRLVKHEAILKRDSFEVPAGVILRDTVASLFAIVILTERFAHAQARNRRYN